MMLRLLVLSLCCLAVSASGGGGGGGDGPEHPLTVHYAEDVMLRPDGIPMSEGEIMCHHQMHFCHMNQSSYVSDHIAHGYDPAMLLDKCEHDMYKMCMEEIRMNCSEYQELYMKSIEMASEYICDHIDDYADTKWEELNSEYMHIENEFCVEQFAENGEQFVVEYIDLIGKPMPVDVDEQADLEHDQKAKQKECCGYFYALIGCFEESVGRQADDTDLGDWQYEVLSKYYEPQMEQCECKIGKGITLVFRNAMIIVAALMVFILGLATCSGCANCCGEKMNKHKRRCKQCCYCCYQFEEDEEYFERQYEKKLEVLYGVDNNGYDRKSYAA